jgi:hypothetical protein
MQEISRNDKMNRNNKRFRFSYTLLAKCQAAQKSEVALKCSNFVLWNMLDRGYCARQCACEKFG